MVNVKFTGKHSVAVSSNDLLNKSVKENEPKNTRKEQPTNIKVYSQEKSSENIKENVSTRELIDEADKLGDKILKGQVENNYWHKWI